MGFSGFAPFLGHPILHVQDVKSVGVDGGTFTSGSWQQRDINTVIENGISGASLGSNQVTLPAGEYQAQALAAVHYVSSHSLRFHNLTAGSAHWGGMNFFSEVGYGGDEPAFVQSRFVLGVASVIRIDHRCTNTRATNGCGVAGGFRGLEIYLDAMFWRLTP